ncbi:MAG: 50S ribosomal protein L9 [Bacteroidales bacterium]|jgi:large subunit ribosomal protein L9
MDIILKQDVANLGHAEDIVTVKNGYGRNYLIPQGLASLATPSARKMHAENQKQRAHKQEKIREEAVALQEKMEGTKLTIGAKTSTKGKIFGSVNTIQIAESLNKLGFDVDRRQISIKEELIKEIGTYTAIVKLHREVKVDIEFEIVSE